MLLIAGMSAGGGAQAGQAHAPFQKFGGDVDVETWQARQERGVVMQNLDASCGSAAVATILRYFYGHKDVGELEILRRIDPHYLEAVQEAKGTDDGAEGASELSGAAKKTGSQTGQSAKQDREREDDFAASFAEMSAAVAEYGYKGIGVAATFEKLETLKIPAIVHVKYRDQYDHFSVLRGVGKHGTVRLADPSWGNRKLSRHQFMDMWRTRPDKQYAGKIMLIVPEQMQQAEVRRRFFDAPKPLSIPLKVVAPR